MFAIPEFVWWLFGGGVAAAGAAKLTSGVSQAADNTTNDLIKLAVVGVVGFVVLKKFKVL